MVLTACAFFFALPASASDPPTSVHPEPPVAGRRRPLRPGGVRALAFVPIPGFPSLVQGDPVNAGLSLALTAPVAALWIGAATSTAEWDAERWAVSAGGAYAITVVVNQVTGMRSYRRRHPVVSVLPQRGGARVVIHTVW